MRHPILPFAKIITTGLIAAVLSACVATEPPQSSSSAVAVSSVMQSSIASSVGAVSSSSLMPSSSSLAISSSSLAVSSSSIMPSSSSVAMSSSSMVASSSSAANCSSVNVTKGETAFKAGNNLCSACHGSYDSAKKLFTGGTRNIDPNKLTDTTSTKLSSFIASSMMKTKAGCGTDTTCIAEAAEIAKYINSKSNNTQWCQDGTPPASSSSVASSSSIASSSSVASSGDLVVLYAVNAGGKGFMSANGINFSGDNYVTGGNLGTTTAYINNTQDQDLFTTERWGNFTYDFPVKAGTYEVTFYVAESWFGNGNEGGAGNRVFDINAEGKTIVSAFNPLAVVGPRDAHIFERKNISVNDGSLSLEFKASVDAASIRAIVVRGLEGNKGDAPTGNTGTVGKGPVPADCSGSGTVGANDLVLIDGGSLPAINGGTLALHQNWMLDEAWAVPQGAKLQVVTSNGGAAISYSNASIYTGFKFSPPVTFGERTPFYLSGVDLYVQVNSGSPQFGLRVIKPGENEGNGGASTTTWVRNSNGQQDLTPTTSCQLMSLTMPSGWNAASTKANRFILEVKNGWNNSSELKVRRMVIKNYKAAN